MAILNSPLDGSAQRFAGHIIGKEQAKKSPPERAFQKGVWH